VLLVEDHAPLGRMIEHVLAAVGIKSTLVDSGDAAAALLQSGLRPDLLLTDIRMPGSLNGLALARLVRQLYPSIGILLCTGFADIDTDEFKVLRKPVDPDVMLAAIETAILRHRQDRA
jgi:CheY-like chemotaxis protein